MKTRYRLISRGSRGNAYYSVDTLTGRRRSLGDADRDAAEQIVAAQNQALRQPSLNLQIARAYLSGSDSGVGTRTWQLALDGLISTKSGSTQQRWLRASRDRALDPLRGRLLIETQGEHFLAALAAGSTSTNVHLRKLHNFCLDMGWILAPVLPKRQWPKFEFKEKRAITAAEHEAIIAREPNPETRSFYQLLWHLGGSQTDVATLTAESVDWTDRVISYVRHKTGVNSQLHLGEQALALLAGLPRQGLLFPRMAAMDEKYRATEFRKRCRGLGISGVSLHSYRYAWAERAKTCGYPERFAQEALGHNSKAVHRAYARKASVLLPSLEEFESQARKATLIRFPGALQGVDSDHPTSGVAVGD